MAKKSPFEGLDLARQVSPTGQLDQQLFQSRPRPISPVQQPDRPQAEPENQETKETSNEVSLETSKQVNQVPSQSQKATFGLPPEVLDTLEDIKQTLRRKYGVKLSKERIVAEAILQLNEDLIKNKEKSILVSKKNGNQGSKE